MHFELRRIGDGRQALLRETGRAVTPFGGLVTVVELLRRMGAVETVRRLLPFRYESNNRIVPEHTLLAFWLAVMAGARRFAHLQMLRCDEALRGLCGVRAFPSDDTVRNFFRRFGQGEVERFFPPLWQWFFAHLPAAERTLDLDSTTFQRYGHQQGACRGYNERRNGRGHRPLVAFVSEPVLALHGWLRSGHASDPRDAVQFLREALALLPPGHRLAGVRADGAFFDQKLLTYLEDQQLRYVVVARRKEGLQAKLHGLQQWRRLDATSDIAEFDWQMPAWNRPRRFVVVRLHLPDPTERRLLNVPGYDFRVFVTNRTEPAEWIWRHYDQRAAIEPRFSELKTDLGADDFCLQEFFATEAVFRSVLLVFNLLGLLQFLDRPGGIQRRPATLRHSLLCCGAIAGRSGHKFVLFLSQSWGGLQSRKPLLHRIHEAFVDTSPKLNPATFAPP
jgi:hypothetical protein